MARAVHPSKDPASAELRAAWQLAEAGDVRAARQAAERVLAGQPSAEDRAQAEELLERTRTPRGLYAYGLLALVVMALLIALAVVRY